MHWMINFTTAALACFFLCFHPAMAKETAPSANSSARIKTSAYSFMCKTNIESAAKKLNGVSEAFLDLSDKTLTVNYNPLKTTKERIAESVENLGYNVEIIREAIGIESELGYKASYIRALTDTNIFEYAPKHIDIAR